PPWREIVGVVGDIRLGGTQGKREPAMYLPADQLPQWCCLYSVVRTALDSHSLAATVQRIGAEKDKDIPLAQVRTMNELMFTHHSQPRVETVLLRLFAGLAITSTVVGLD